MIEPTAFKERQTTLTKSEHHFVGEFTALGCPCQVLIETDYRDSAETLVRLARGQAWRIEAHWSRYLPTSLVQQINDNPTHAWQLDAETALVLDYCTQLWEWSEGAFDITSGALRKLWTFDGGSNVPQQASISALLAHVGWHKVNWQTPMLSLGPDMEIDLGGVGKEYAVDLCCTKLREASDLSCLVNFGGDCAVTHPPQRTNGWRVGIENATQPGSAAETVELSSGALATSGVAHRYVLHQGKKLSHILDARNGWPVVDAPASVTVQADTCLQAGMLATLACLEGPAAEEFLQTESDQFWLQLR
jgi:thiamine biosynthesis lipoprotein